MNKCKIFGILLGLFFCITISACGNSKGETGFVDGYYTAKMARDIGEYFSVPVNS